MLSYSSQIKEIISKLISGSSQDFTKGLDKPVTAIHTIKFKSLGEKVTELKHTLRSLLMFEISHSFYHTAKCMFVKAQ